MFPVRKSNHSGGSNAYMPIHSNDTNINSSYDDASVLSDGSGSNQQDHITKTYGLFDLLCIGVGATVGSGVFVLTGLVARDIAGPGVVFSWIIAGFACCLSATSFAELSSRFPSSTSSYTFVKHTLGEYPAYLAAWCLSLECGLSAAAVARSWGRKLVSLLSAADGANAVNGTSDEWGFNVYACLLQCAAVLLFLAGKDVSKVVINIFTIAKVLLIVFMITMGLYLFEVKNFQPQIAPMGWDGILRGATMCFFGFVGYDEVCCLALETKHAKLFMPRAVFGTIALVCVLYGLSSIALVGMQRYTLIDRDNGFAMAFAQSGYSTASSITAVGEMVMLPLVVLLSFLPQPRILAALARDHLAPSFLAHTSGTDNNLVAAILVSGIIAIFIASFVPFVILNDVISAGVLLSFNATNSALILVRCDRPSQPSPPHSTSAALSSPRPHSSTGASTLLSWLSSYFSMSQCQVLLLAYHSLAILFALQISHYNSSSSSQSNSSMHHHHHTHTNKEAGLLGMTTVMLIGIGIGMSYLCPDRLLPAGAVTSTNELTTEQGLYHTPAVPFIPLMGICINTLLIFQLSVYGLYMFVGYFAVATIMYVLQKLMGARSRQQSNDAPASATSRVKNPVIKNSDFENGNSYEMVHHQ